MTLKPLFVFLACVLFCGCWFSNQSVPMPLNEAEFPKPTVKSLKFSAPRKFKWNVVPPDSIHRGHIYPFDISKLPSQSFNPAGFKELPKLALHQPFHYNSLPDTILNLDIIPSEPLIYKTFLLGALKKTTLSPPKLKAESFHAFFQYGDEQGLPAEGVTATLRTRDGLMWIASIGGLCILHGESMEILPYNYGDIFFMKEDALGQVWLTTRSNGLFAIDRKAGIQKQFYGMKNLVDVRIDPKGFVWVTSFRDGVYLINPEKKSFKHLTSKNGLSSSSSMVTVQDQDGRVWVANGTTGIDIIDPEEKKIKRLGKELGTPNGAIYNLAETRSGDMYGVGVNRGIDIINIRKGTHIYLDSVAKFKHAEVFGILEDTEGRMWFSSDSSGILILSKNKDSVYNIAEREGVGDILLSLAYSNRNQIFAPSISSGLNVFPPADGIAHHLSKKEGLLDNNVWSLFEDSKNRIWIGTYDGVNIITPEKKIYALRVNASGTRSERVDAILQTGTEQFVTSGPGSGLSLIDESKHTLEKIGLKEGLPTISIRHIFADSHGMIWIESNDSGIFLFDPVKRTIRYLNQASGLSSNQVDAVQEDSSGKFWIASFGGIDLLDLKENTIASYTTKEGLSNDIAVSVVKDSKSRFWVPTEKGLNLLDPAKMTNTIFSISNGMPSNGIYSLIEKNGHIYAGTGKGLTILDETEKTVSGSKESVWNLQTYGRSLGFPAIDFNGNTVMVTHSGEFWWGIVPGITMVNESVIKPDTVQAPVDVVGLDIMGKAQYFFDPGLIVNEDTVWGDIKDTFYLKRSFGEFNTDKQKGIEWKSLSAINMPVGLSLPHERNYLRFHFGDFLPQYTGDYKYQYILVGVDEKWSGITDAPFSENYNNISPGYYTFRVSTRRGNGAWSQPSEFHFRIRPPWWFSWWAELTYVLIAISLLRLWVRYRSRRLLKENLLLEQKVSERTMELSTSLENLRQTQGQLIQAEKMASLGELTAGIAHEIQNPLNFVNNFSEVNTELLEDVNKALDQGDIPEVKDILKDVEMNMGKIAFHGKRADAIVKGMLLHSRASSGQKIMTDINALADEYLRLSYHGLRAKDKSFNAQFNMDLDESLSPVMLVQQDFGRVLLNIFNNAFYSVTEKKKQMPENYQPTVSVITKKKKDTIEIRIRDNGQGIPKKVIDKIYQPFFTTKPAGQGTGLGLSLSYDIITKEHNGKIDVATKENEFTEFIIELPAQAAA